jgi:hypothetical protein
MRIETGAAMVDRFTKAVLTVIAVSLLTIAIENAHWSAKAQSVEVQRVAICDRTGAFCADFDPISPSRVGLDVVNNNH